MRDQLSIEYEDTLATTVLPRFSEQTNRNGSNGLHSTYEPISSVWEGTDAELIEAMLGFYPVIPPTPILDSTYNAGRMWKGSKRRVVSMDIDPRYKPSIVADNRVMKGVPSGKFGVVGLRSAARLGRREETKAANDSMLTSELLSNVERNTIGT